MPSEIEQLAEIEEEINESSKKPNNLKEEMNSKETTPAKIVENDIEINLEPEILIESSSFSIFQGNEDPTKQPKKEPDMLNDEEKISPPPKKEKTDEKESTKVAQSKIEGTPSEIIHVANLVRPFSLTNYKVWLAKNCSNLIENEFWIDSIKSQSIVHFFDLESSKAASEFLSKQTWPMASEKLLKVKFLTPDEAESIKKGIIVSNDPPKTEMTKKMDEPPSKIVAQAFEALEDCFNKTEATPHIFWMKYISRSKHASSSSSSTKTSESYNKVKEHNTEQSNKYNLKSDKDKRTSSRATEKDSLNSSKISDKSRDSDLEYKAKQTNRNSSPPMRTSRSYRTTTSDHVSKSSTSNLEKCGSNSSKISHYTSQNDGKRSRSRERKSGKSKHAEERSRVERKRSLSPVYEKNYSSSRRRSRSRDRDNKYASPSKTSGRSRVERRTLPSSDRHRDSGRSYSSRHRSPIPTSRAHIDRKRSSESPPRKSRAERKRSLSSDRYEIKNNKHSSKYSDDDLSHSRKSKNERQQSPNSKNDNKQARRSHSVERERMADQKIVSDSLDKSSCAGKSHRDSSPPPTHRNFGKSKSDKKLGSTSSKSSDVKSAKSSPITPSGSSDHIKTNNHNNQIVSFVDDDNNLILPNSIPKDNSQNVTSFKSDHSPLAQTPPANQNSSPIAVDGTRSYTTKDAASSCSSLNSTYSMRSSRSRSYSSRSSRSESSHSR